MIGQLEGHSSSVLGVAYNARGDRIASRSSDKTAVVWDASSHNTASNAGDSRPSERFQSLSVGPDAAVRHAQLFSVLCLKGATPLS